MKNTEFWERAFISTLVAVASNPKVSFSPDELASYARDVAYLASQHHVDAERFAKFMDGRLPPKVQTSPGLFDEIDPKPKRRRRKDDATETESAA